MGNSSSNLPKLEEETSEITNVNIRIELLVMGFIRVIQINTGINIDKNIYDVVISFYHQCYAKYLSIDGVNNYQLIIKQQTQFADIIQIKYQYAQTPFYAVIGNEMSPIPCFIIDEYSKYITIEIPYEICHKLDNSIKYYSKLMRNDNLTKSGGIKWNFIIKHDDNYLLKKFGGCFKSEYEPIKLSFDDNKLISFTVGFDTDFETIFFDQQYQYSYKDIDQFYQIRKKKKKLIKIEIQIENNEFNPHKIISIPFPSGKWEYNFRYNKNAIKDITKTYFIGPVNEKQAMFDIINEVYNTKEYKHTIYKTETDEYGLYVIISNGNPQHMDTIELQTISKWDIELENESKCLTITPSKLKDIIIKCPPCTHLYEWKLFYNTEMDGISINTMYDNIKYMQEYILIIKDNMNNIFGAYIDCKLIKPSIQQKKEGKIKYKGSVDCFVFNYVNKTELKIYKACNKWPYYFRNDEKCIIIGEGENPAIYFEYDFNYGRSVHCNAYNSPSLSSNTQFKIITFELWGPKNV